ncbi:hypothetical protein SAMN02799624_05254 [Paenibacillus sp. UNC496MF]|uniref:hypothetical protein n=1 Tax=Paenibacillus sp. UNC496MF TaxID=1502753 RepID=UPI0008F21567|nr:hypothetical protein [Paenibacillus sp. UNC496MF]SFJ62957.1 hypothetical protein SAMN02799624_05254 [Paenibacillus sp. UNC496MF]
MELASVYISISSYVIGANYHFLFYGAPTAGRLERVDGPCLYFSNVSMHHEAEEYELIPSDCFHLDTITELEMIGDLPIDYGLIRGDFYRFVHAGYIYEGVYTREQNRNGMVMYEFRKLLCTDKDERTSSMQTCTFFPHELLSLTHLGAARPKPYI